MKWIKTALVMLALGLSFSALALEDEDEMAFKDGLMEGKVAVVKKYIEADPKLINEKFFGWTPLQMAANANQVKVAEYLVSKGADLNYVHPNAHHTAFMLAALNGYKEMATYLAKAGADVNVKLKGDVSLIRYFRDEGMPEWVDLLTKLGVKDDGCEGKCF
jgi:uncharacterized protein